MLFDKSVFLDDLNPFPNQVFHKDFDAYFFLEYPLWQYNREEIFNPFYFLNNIQENLVIISNLDELKKLSYRKPISEWDLTPYYQAFTEIFKEERYLFWEGESSRWAIVSDAKKKIAVLGIDWNIAEQVEQFFTNCLLSPIQAMQILDIEQHEAIFLKNYTPSKILTIGNEQNPLWVKYYFQCHVNDENNKLFYWEPFEKLYGSISKVLKNFKTLDMYACQTFDRRYKQRGTIYSTGKFAPVGGWQKYSYENCKKVATKFLTNNEHLRLKFEGKNEESEALYWANKTGLIEFMDFFVYANLEKTKTKGQLSDFHFITYHYNFGNLADEFNQNFQFSYKKSAIAENLMETFVNELIEIGFVKKVHRLERPRKFAKYSKNNWLKIDGMYGATPDLSGEADLFKEII